MVFPPAGLSLVRDGPSQRRAFLDGAISQVMPRYQRTMADAMEKASFPPEMPRYISSPKGASRLRYRHRALITE